MWLQEKPPQPVKREVCGHPYIGVCFSRNLRSRERETGQLNQSVQPSSWGWETGCTGKEEIGIADLCRGVIRVHPGFLQLRHPGTMRGFFFLN